MKQLMLHLFQQDVSYHLAYGDDPRVTRAGLISVYITPMGFVAVDVSPSLMHNAEIMQLVQQLVQLAYSELRPDSDLVFATSNPDSLTVDRIPAAEAVRGGGRLAAVEAIRKVAAYLAMHLEDGVTPEGELSVRTASAFSEGGFGVALFVLCGCVVGRRCRACVNWLHVCTCIGSDICVLR
jgi:hypothetical protein